MTTQTHRFGQAEQQARLLIELWAGVQPDSFDVRVNAQVRSDIADDIGLPEAPTTRL
jgi:hypothetical protein